jgi:2'-hydroxyisoflavone reductase
VHILIIGGTRFLGRFIAESALSRGHRVTLFHRGNSMPAGLPGATSVVGDRARNIAAISGEYDAVIDTCGYFPRDVAGSCAHVRAMNADTTYAFVSSVSAYRDGLTPGADESAPLWETGDPNATEMTPEGYGPLKALCENAVLECFGSRALIVRPGLIVGPYDGSDRFTYWIRRIGEGGTVLVPGPPTRLVQLIDARDLAEWMVAMVETGRAGIFNATGPLDPLSFGAFARDCSATLESDVEFVWVSQEFLFEHGVEPWTEMPLWVPDEEGAGWDTISPARAIADGLTYRPLQTTIRDTWRWDLARDRNVPLKAGITAEREVRLLQAFADGLTRL